MGCFANTVLMRGTPWVREYMWDEFHKYFIKSSLKHEIKRYHQSSSDGNMNFWLGLRHCLGSVNKTLWVTTLHKSTWVAQKIPSWFSCLFVTRGFASQFNLKGRGVFKYHWLSMVGEQLLLCGICTRPLRFLTLTWTSLPKCGKSTQLPQVLPACTCESAEPS